ncbi:MAG: TIGR02757 family protein [Deltaproteobacteria bacterium]|nr:TIGR02757 family protein [Deltaproteobacteria bacterium]
MSSPRVVTTGALLERHYTDFNFEAHVPRDPVQFPHRYERPEDVEVIGFIAASLAFGRVAAFEPHLAEICGQLGDEPAATLKAAAQESPDPKALARVEEASGWQYRWIKPADLRALLLALGRSLNEWGTLEKGFAAGLPKRGTKAWKERGIWGPLGTFLQAMKQHAIAVHEAPEERARALGFLFPSVKGAAACKRQHMFLRWMVRPKTEGIDFGLWTSLKPKDLVCPADVHTARIGNALGLCSSPEPSRKVADELTRSLRLFDNDDPTRFDFALAHLGISGGCRAAYFPTVCETCALKECCQWWGRY